MSMKDRLSRGREASFSDIISWLVRVEKMAADVYRASVTSFTDDPGLTELLIELHNDEQMHLNMMTMASSLRDPGGGRSPAITLDDEVRRNVEGFLGACGDILKAKKVDKAGFLECVVSAEFSEWNEIFLYVINALKREHREFIPSVVKMEQHKRSIGRYLASKGEYLFLYRRIARLPRLWDELILVVDDSVSITDVLVSILENEGSVVTASNGREALGLLDGDYFSAIISGVDMPVMDGIEFYKEAERRYPGISSRVLFFSGTASPGALAFLRENGLRFLPKPASIKTLKDAVLDIISR